jgi:hypothetical protein
MKYTQLFEQFINEAKDFKELVGASVTVTRKHMGGEESHEHEISELRYHDGMGKYLIYFKPVNPVKNSSWDYPNMMYHITGSELKNLKAGKEHRLTHSINVIKN